MADVIKVRIDNNDDMLVSQLNMDIKDQKYYMNKVTIGNEIKIKNVKKLWNEITRTEIPVNIDLNKLEKVDGAGFQLLVKLFQMEQNFPEKYTLSGLSENMSQTLVTYGYNHKKGDVKK